MEKAITKRQKELLGIIYDYIKNTGYPPTFEEMREKLNVSSNQSIMDLLLKLGKGRVLQRNSSAARGLTILPLGYELLGRPPLAAFLGAAAAGAPVEAIEIPGEWKTISSDVARLEGNIFILKISGDSMINAGINDGDAVLVKEHREFSSGDVVVARVEDGVTVKRFISEDKPPYVYLKPENPKYPIIPFTHEMEMTGKVISVLKDGYWKPVK